MSTISQLEKDNAKLNDIKSTIDDINSYLKLSVNGLVDLSNNIDNRYLIDDNNTPIFDRIKKLKSSIESTEKYLTNTVKAEATINISKNNTTIKNIKIEEEKKRQQKLADEKKKAKEKEEAEKKKKQAAQLAALAKNVGNKQGKLN